jgi:hypothetical protein
MGKNSLVLLPSDNNPIFHLTRRLDDCPARSRLLPSLSIALHNSSPVVRKQGCMNNCNKTFMYVCVIRKFSVIILSIAYKPEV